MTEKYKLTYFQVRGRGEPVRMMFNLAGVDFEDDRVDSAAWPAMKSKTPLGFLPILETSEGVLSQSLAIFLFVAEKTGFLPAGEFKRAQVNSILHTIGEVQSFVSSNVYISEIYKFAPTPDDLEDKKKACREKIAWLLNFVESLAQKEAKYIFGGKMTVADIMLFSVFKGFLVVFSDLESQYAWLKTFMKAMRSDEKMAEYLKNRPSSTMGV